MIDTHHHFWKYSPDEYGWISDEMPQLQKDFLVPELNHHLDMSGVDQVISVQARCSDQENRFLLDCAKHSEELVAAIVGWAPLCSPDLRIFLDQYINEPLFKGIREIIQGCPDEQFLDNPDFDHGMREITHRDLAFDLLVFHDQLPSAIAFADKHPNQRMVLNHCGKPPVSNEGMKDPDSKSWARNIRELARRPHIYCKLSGLTTEIQDPESKSQSTRHHDLLRPYVDTIIHAFGPQRVMFGSDWPVSLLGTDYPAWLNLVDEFTLSLSPDEQAAIQHETAAAFYQI
ncbi:amidohydrolase family protein [Verrucomicrobiaceae bacterium N1E253]|uniref:Amidohydrolase family protein n=1 Tax=Oceaniferula marina TaxID=2748318 RepID=A0A851GFV6_9BACT|nr:amidohydrolase family protein [Oceaniferula marina]NWK56658.1 amidohydrolase family protein [Oceaniferula marina]